MNSKQRVEKSLNFIESDRVPVDFWATNTLTARLVHELGLKDSEELLKAFHIDLRYIQGAVLKEPYRIDQDGVWKDIFGVLRKKVYVDYTIPEKGSYEHVVYSPLASAETSDDIENYGGWPSDELYDYTNVKSSAMKYHDYAVVCGGDRLNRTAQLKPAMYLRGIEQTFIDLAINPEIVESITEKLVDFYLRYNKRIFDSADGTIDIFYMGDDFGTQKGLMISIEMWRKYFKKGFRKFIDLAHSYGIKVMHHTCGSIAPLIPEFIDCGLDILQSLQPRAEGMDFKKIKKEYGKYISFHGGIDIQHTLPFGSKEDVKKEVISRINDLGPGGGYILCSAHNIQNDTPVENITTFYKTALEYGRY